MDLKEEQGKSALWVNLQQLLKFDLLGSRNCKQLLSTITLKADRNLEQVHLSFYHTPSCSSLLKPWLHIHTFFLFSTLTIRAHPSPLTSVRVRWLEETANGEIPELNISADTAMGCEWLLVYRTWPSGLYNPLQTENYFNVPPTSSLLGNRQTLPYITVYLASQHLNVLKNLLITTVVYARYIFRMYCYKCWESSSLLQLRGVTWKLRGGVTT